MDATAVERAAKILARRHRLVRIRSELLAAASGAVSKMKVTFEGVSVLAAFCFDRPADEHVGANSLFALGLLPVIEAEIRAADLTLGELGVSVEDAA
jgi:hypothetical protein